nr:molybdopterin dinucleotide binding domain-containing protein [Parafrankia soli]
MLAELGQRLGYQLADSRSGQVTDDTLLAEITAHARRPFGEVVSEGWVEVPREIPAPWVDGHVERMGGWRLAPRLLVDQLAALQPPAPLVLTPRRQKRHLNSQFDYLGEQPEIILHPDDATAAGVVDSQPVTVHSTSGEITGIAKVDGTIRRGAVSIPHGHQSANVNRLTDRSQVDIVTGMVRYCGIPVSVHPA